MARLEKKCAEKIGIFFISRIAPLGLIYCPFFSTKKIQDLHPPVVNSDACFLAFFNWYAWRAIKSQQKRRITRKYASVSNLQLLLFLISFYVYRDRRR